LNQKQTEIKAIADFLEKISKGLIDYNENGKIDSNRRQALLQASKDILRLSQDSRPSSLLASAEKKELRKIVNLFEGFTNVLIEYQESEKISLIRQTDFKSKIKDFSGLGE